MFSKLDALTRGSDTVLPAPRAPNTVPRRRALLALADSNVAALQARALALSGLAAATGDPARATQAVQAFARARAITSAAGAAADTRGLLNVIASHDRSGFLAEVRAAQDWRRAFPATLGQSGLDVSRSLASDS